MSSLLRDLERVQPAETPKDEPEQSSEIAEAFQDALIKLSEKVDNLTSQLLELTKETERPKDPEDPDDEDPKDPEEEG